MARDAELDRLKVAQDVAFQRKQNAYQAQQTAWEKLSSARDERTVHMKPNNVHIIRKIKRGNTTSR